MSGLFLNIVSSSADMARSAVPAINNLWAWGLNTDGQLGLNNTTTTSSPVQVGALGSWTKVVASTAVYPHTNIMTIARQSTGTLWSWGNGGVYGKLGLGGLNFVSSPVQIGTSTQWSSEFCASGNSTFAVKTTGTLWAWGLNTNGQLGLGYTNVSYALDRNSPVQVGILTNWATVGTGNQNTAAIKTDGTLWTWGYNASGALGLGDVIKRSSPVQVGALNDWSRVYCKSTAMIAIKTNGTLWSWGYNGSGVLGLGDTITRSSPVQVGALNTWSTVSGNNGFNKHFIALQTNGTLWAWGDNQYGPCATGSLSGNLSSPTQIGSLTTWTSATNGQYTSAAIKAPGTLWVCGRNNFGRLGLNSTSNTGGGLEQVGTATNWKQVSLGSYNSAALRG